MVKISIYRNKQDFIPLPEVLEPKVDWDNINGVELKRLLRKHRISTIKTKEELMQVLKNKQAISLLQVVSL